MASGLGSGNPRSKNSSRLYFTLTEEEQRSASSRTNTPAANATWLNSRPPSSLILPSTLRPSRACRSQYSILPRWSQQVLFLSSFLSPLQRPTVTVLQPTVQLELKCLSAGLCTRRITTRSTMTQAGKRWRDHHRPPQSCIITSTQKRAFCLLIEHAAVRTLTK